MVTTKKVYETATVYGLCDPRTSELRYVGCTVKPLAKRVNEHLNELRTGSYGNPVKTRWLAELVSRQLKPEAFEIEVVAFEGRRGAERFWIQYFCSIGCKLTNCDNHPHRDEYRRERQAERLVYQQYCDWWKANRSVTGEEMHNYFADLKARHFGLTRNQAKA